MHSPYCNPALSNQTKTSLEKAVRDDLSCIFFYLHQVLDEHIGAPPCQISTEKNKKETTRGLSQMKNALEFRRWIK